MQFAVDPLRQSVERRAITTAPGFQQDRDFRWVMHRDTPSSGFKRKLPQRCRLLWSPSACTSERWNQLMKQVATLMAAGSLLAAFALAQPGKPSDTITDLGPVGETPGTAFAVSGNGLVAGAAATP